MLDLEKIKNQIIEIKRIKKGGEPFGKIKIRFLKETILNEMLKSERGIIEIDDLVIVVCQPKDFKHPYIQFHTKESWKKEKELLLKS